MKAITVDEFKVIGVKEQSPEKKKAIEIVNTFVKHWETNEDNEPIIMEVEESDFDNAFDFSNPKQILRAANLLRQVANKNAKYNIAIKQRDKRLFIGMREELESNYTRLTYL
jgi:hypothetical protein